MQRSAAAIKGIGKIEQAFYTLSVTDPTFRTPNWHTGVSDPNHQRHSDGYQSYLQ